MENIEIKCIDSIIDAVCYSPNLNCGGGKFLDTHIVISLLVFVLSKYHRDKIDILMAKVHKINETSKRRAKYFLSLA